MNQTVSVSPAAASLSNAPLPQGPAPFVLHVFPSFEVGGSQRRFAQLVHRFLGKYRHIVRSMNGRSDALSLLDASAPCEFQPLGFERGSAFSNIRAARRALDTLKPDLLVTYNWGATEWAAANHPRAVRHIHIEDGFGPEEAHKRFLRRGLFRRLVLNRHSTVVVPSRTLKRIALEEWGLDPHRVRYIPNGIDCSRFHSAPDTALTSHFRGEGPTIGTVATLRREKALDRMISALALVRAHMPARLVIVGDGPDRGRLEAFAAARGLTDHITFTGALAAPERILKAFDVFSISSDTEQMPLSILEAMAAGRAIASTDAGDIKAMIAEENRPYVVPKYDVALASMMMAQLRDPDLRRRLGEANQARAAAEFDERQMVEAYDRLFAGEVLH
jgi:glycosyltransferase involved in cell wall biosynthesis